MREVLSLEEAARIYLKVFVFLAYRARPEELIHSRLWCGIEIAAQEHRQVLAMLDVKLLQRAQEHVCLPQLDVREAWICEDVRVDYTD
jgi:hypothetical protein